MEPFSIVKFLQGFNPLNGKNWGKILFYGIFLAIALTIYNKVFEPKNTTTIEKIEKQVVNQCQADKSWLRLRVWKIANISLGE